MPFRRSTFVLLGSVLAGLCTAQSVQHKHLLISLGGGGGLTTLYSNSNDLEARALASSAVRFAFDYAMSERLSLGGHYDRIGSVVHPGDVDRLRFTTYLIAGTYRPFIGRHAAIETTVGVGGAIMVLMPEGHLIPYGYRAPVLSVGARYLHMFNESIGGFISADHAHGIPRRVTFHGETVHTPAAVPLEITWHSQRITAGMFVRF